MTRRDQQVGLRSTPAGIEALIAATGAHPLQTMLVAQEAFVLARRGSGIVDADVAISAHTAATRALSPAFEEVWRSLPSASQATLLAVGRGESPWATRGPRATKRAMDALLDRGIPLRWGRGRYRFVEVLLEEWVRSVG